MTMEILSDFLNLFFPRLCVCCKQKLIKQESHICLKCLLSIPLIKQNKNIEDNELEKLFSGRFPFITIASYAYFIKGGVLQKITHEIKYKNNPDLAFLMGTLCGRIIKENQKFKNIDYIVPIPLHPKREKERGYNQAFLLAKGISHILDISIEKDNLIRVRNNPTQTKHNKIQRWQNTENIFAIKNKDIYKNKHILLIDDIITTGSTIEICSKLISESEGSCISIYTLGFVP